MKRYGILFIILIFLSVSLFSQSNFRTAQEYDDYVSTFIDSNQYDRAIELYNEGLRLFPNNSLIYSGLAYTYYIKKDIERAINFCNIAINYDNNNERPYRYLGYIYFDRKDYNRAIEYYTRSINILPTRSVTYNNRGRAYGLLGQNNNAINDFQKAIELNPRDDDSYSLLSALLFNNNRYGEAISYANRALEINPNNSTARNVLSTAERNGISINERGVTNINITVQIGMTMNEYLTEYPYLQAHSLNTLIDNRSRDTGIIFTYNFDRNSNKLTLASLEDYSNNRLDRFNVYLTEWIRNNNELHESNEQGARIIVNMTPQYQSDSANVFLSLSLTNNKMMLSYSIIYK